MAGQDDFSANGKAASGPLKGYALWSDAANWDSGVPVNGDQIDVGATGDDDLSGLNLDSAFVDSGTVLTVTGASLTIGELNLEDSTSVIDALALPGQGPVTVTIGRFAFEDGQAMATGAGARLVVQLSSGLGDVGEFLTAASGGTVEMLGPASGNWTLIYDVNSAGTFALDHPGATTAALLKNVRAGDVLELPGVSVSNVTFGTTSLSVTTSAGVYAFTNVAYEHVPKSYSAAVDPVTGLVGITFADQDVFTPSTKAASGSLSGDYVWSNAANWAGGVPADGEVVSAGATGYDDIAALQLSSLTLNEAGAAANVFVTGASLTITDLEQSGAGGSGMLEADATDAGAHVIVTVQHSGVQGATFEAKGAGAKLLDQAATDTASNTYVVENGGLVELSNTPYSGDIFSYMSSGTFAFKNPGAVVSSLMLGVSIGDTLEVPGTTVSNVTLGTGSLTITTEAGTYEFDAVTYNPGSQIEGYTAAFDPMTGLEAITFAGPDKLHYKSTGVTYWSDPTNWSRGLPINGDNVLLSAVFGSTDDIPVLSLNSLNLAGNLSFASAVHVTGMLAVGTLYAFSGDTVIADATASGTPATVTIGAIASAVPGFIGAISNLGAAGAHATLIDNATTDAGTNFAVYSGGTVEITSETPSDHSQLSYGASLGTFALWHPAATSAMLVYQPIPGDALELPGTSVSGVTFGSNSLSVTTDAGTYSFSHVIYVPAQPIIGYTAAVDPATGLVAITFTGPDVFEENVKATSGPLAGAYLWSNPANWSRGLPVDNDTVVFADPSGTSSDDLTTLTLNSLTLGAGGHVYVEGGSSLTVANLVGAAGSELFPDSADDGITAPSSVTVGTITGTGALYAAKGTGASFIDRSASDAGEIYQASSGGLVELAAAPADASSLDYVGVATFALQHPSASSAASLQGVAPGDTLELPGTSVSAATFGTHSLSVITDAGTYAFTNVTYANPVTGYTAAHDPTTGLEAITFTGPDVFEQNVKATSGPLSGYYLWSNPANWSNGIPVNGDSVAVGSNENLAVDDLSALALSTLTSDSQLYVVGTSLTVATASLDSLVVGLLTSDPATVTLGTVTDAGAFFSDGANSRLIDQSVVDASAFNRVYEGGFAEFSGPPSAPYAFSFYGPGTLAFINAGVSNTAALSGVGPGDILELPGVTVLSASFGANSLSVTTDAGTYAFTNVTYANPVAGYTAALDPTTGLAAITFTGPDVFEQNVKATSGPLSGYYLWSNPANWSNGIPVNGDSVVLGSNENLAVDDLSALTLSTLTADSQLYVVGTSLTVATASLDSLVVGLLTSDPATVTLGTVTDAGAFFSDGANSRLIDQSVVDASAFNRVYEGGFAEFSGPPSAPYAFSYYGPGTLAFINAGVSNSAALSGVGPGDILELPGVTVLSASFGANSLSVTTDAGTYAFTNVTYATSVAGYTAALDPTTGLEAITFTGPDVFEANVKATSGEYAGDYLWSNAANWSNGVPVDGDSVVVRDIGATGYDDLASLTLTSLDMNYSVVDVTGHSLTVGTVTGGGIFANPAHFSFLIADAVDAGAPVTITVGTITGSRGTYQAIGTGASFVDQSATDASNTYEVGHGGSLTMSATPDSASDFDYFSDGTPSKLILEHPATVAGADFNYIVPGDVLELPGTSVSSVTFGANSLNVTTDAGSYPFFVLNHDVTKPVTGYTDAVDPTTGLMAITFTGTGPAPPTLALQHDTGISANDHITSDPTLSYVLSNNADTFRFSVDGNGFSAVAPDFAAHPLADGVHTVAVEEVDPAGNVSAASHLTFTLDTVTPHWTGLTASPGSGSAFAGTTVQLTLDFNEAVDVTGGTPSLTLNDGGDAVYDAAATALLGDSSKLVFDHLVTSDTPSTPSLAVTGLVAHGADINDLAGNSNPADLSHVTAAFSALAINESFAPAYRVDGITRPQLELDATGHIILDAAASAAAAAYGIKFLYMGLPPSTPYPPVADTSHDFHMV